MSHSKDCIASYFRDASKIRFNLRPVVLEIAHIGEAMTLLRPSIPLFPLYIDTTPGSGQLKPLAVADVQTQNKWAENIANMAYSASVNYYAGGGVPSGNPRYVDGEFGTYLAKRFGLSNDVFTRYIQTTAQADQFYLVADPAWTPLQYYNALNELPALFQQQGDPDAFIAPGVYSWGFLDPVAIDVTAFKTANINFWGWMMLELNPTP